MSRKHPLIEKPILSSVNEAAQRLQRMFPTLIIDAVSLASMVKQRIIKGTKPPNKPTLIDEAHAVFIYNLLINSKYDKSGQD